MKLVTIRFMSDHRQVALHTGILDGDLGRIIGETVLTFARGRIHIDMAYVEGLPARAAARVQREARAVHCLAGGVVVVAQ